MAVIKHPQHDLPPDLLRGRISGASVEQCNDLLVGEFFGADEPTGVTGSAQVSASASLTATGAKGAVKAASDSAAASVNAGGKKDVSGSVADSLTAAVAPSGKKATASFATLAAQADTQAHGGKSSTSGVSLSAAMSETASGEKGAIGAVNESVVGSVAATGVAYVAPPNVNGTAAVSASASLSASGGKGTSAQLSFGAIIAVAIGGRKSSLESITLGADCFIVADGTKSASGLAEIMALASAIVPKAISPDEIRKAFESAPRQSKISVSSPAAWVVATQDDLVIRGATVSTIGSEPRSKVVAYD